MAKDWSDETVLEVRDWLSTLAELILQVDQKTQENEKESNCIHPRVNRRTKQRI